MVAALLVAAPSLAGSFVQLSSSETQLGGTTPKVVTLNQNGALEGITNSKGVVTFKEAGAYFVIAAAQVGSTEANGKGTVRIWRRQNGKDVDNSHTEQAVANGFTAVLACRGVMECKAGDKVELLQSTGGTGLDTVASRPKGEPVVPSMILSIVKVADRSYPVAFWHLRRSSFSEVAGDR